MTHDFDNKPPDYQTRYLSGLTIFLIISRPWKSEIYVYYIYSAATEIVSTAYGVDKYLVNCAIEI